MRSRLLEFADGQLAEAACFSNKLCDVSVDGHVARLTMYCFTSEVRLFSDVNVQSLPCPKKVRPRPGHVLILPFPSATISMLHLWAVRHWWRL